MIKVTNRTRDIVTLPAPYQGILMAYRSEILNTTEAEFITAIGGLDTAGGVFTIESVGSSESSTVTENTNLGGGSTITGENIPGEGSLGGRTGFSSHIVVSNQAAAFTGTRYFALPASPEAWVTYIMKDGKGDAATNNIDVAPGSVGHTIDGSSASAVISSNYGALSFVFDGINNWSIV